jgi:HK97 family phage portal protein
VSQAAITPTRAPLRSRVWSALKSLVGVNGQEGSWRGPFYGITEFGNWRELASSLADGWQQYLTLNRKTLACIPVIASIRHLHRSAFAQLRPAHKHQSPSGQIEIVTTSAAARVLLSPNDYETWSDFAARLVDEWLGAGEVLVIGPRNGRQEVAQLHILPRGSWQLLVDPESRAIFYGVNDNGELLLDNGGNLTAAVPARDVMHLRWATPRHPLIGESPFAAAGVAAGIHVALSHSQLAFFHQMRRPSGVLSTEHILTGEQIEMLRTKFDEQSKAMAQGGIPILGGGLRWHPMSITSEDAEVINTLRMENEEIARTCGVPPPLVGDLSHGSLTATEPLIATWLSISLGGLLERFERGLDRLLGLDGVSDWIDFDLSALLRTDFAARMEALTKGVQGGVLTPNDARRTEGLSPVAGGDQAFMQRQNTPINLLSQLAAAELKKAEAPPPPPPAPAPPIGDAPPPEDDDDPEAEEVARAFVRDAIARAMA